MNTIYIVVASGGEYESKWERNEAAFVNEVDAEQDIVKRKQADADLRAKMETLHAWSKVYEAENPMPIRQARPRMERKKWPAGLGKHEITPEMRAERAEADRLEQEAMRQALDDHKTWTEKAVAALNEQRILLGIEPDVTYRPYPYQEEVDYGIDTVTLYGGMIVPDAKKEGPAP